MKYSIEDSTLSYIADAIRAKEGSSDLIPVIEMGDRIHEIATGSTVLVSAPNGAEVHLETAVVVGGSVSAFLATTDVEEGENFSVWRFTNVQNDTWYAVATYNGETQRQVISVESTYLAYFSFNPDEDDDTGGGTGGDDFTLSDASYLFYNGARLSEKDALMVRLKDLTTTSNMFQGCSDMTSIDVSGLDTSKVVDMSAMFANCNNLSALDVSGFDVGSVQKMGSMFTGCSNLTELDVGDWDTSALTLMTTMFAACSKLSTLNVSGWDTGGVTNMDRMFRGCSSLTHIDVSKWDTSNVTSMQYMFENCSSLVSVDLRGWDTGRAKTIGGMFTGCSALEAIIGFSATNKAGLSITFPIGTASKPCALKRLTFRTDLPDGTYSIRSAINIKYCSFDRYGMVEMFSTLPDISALGLSSGYSTITITGNPCVTDGTLTDEDRAIATTKGWTLVEA